MRRGHPAEEGLWPPDLRQPRGRVFEGRLTATPGTDVTTADVTAGTTLSYTESVGDLISLPWKPGRWEAFQLPRTPAGVREITKTFLASSPWAIVSGSNYDVFGFLGPSGPDLELGPAWASDSARAAAGALARRDGVRVLARDPSRVFLGTIRASASNQTEDSAAKRFVWNAYNQVPRILRYLAADASWTYASATIRQANNSTAYAVACVTGLTQFVHVEVNVATIIGGSDYEVGIGVDSTTTFYVDAVAQYTSPVSGGTPVSSLLDHAALGYRSYSWNEHSVSAGVGVTIYGDSGAGRLQSAINGEVLG